LDGDNIVVLTRDLAEGRLDGKLKLYINRTMGGVESRASCAV
jgi:hypothetical protein